MIQIKNKYVNKIELEKENANDIYIWCYKSGGTIDCKNNVIFPKNYPIENILIKYDDITEYKSFYLIRKDKEYNKSWNIESFEYIDNIF